MALLRWTYERLVQRAHAVADEFLQRLDRLRASDPSAIPAEMVEAVRRFHAQPAGSSGTHHSPERRCAPRFPASGNMLLLVRSDESGPERQVPAVDRSWNGLAVLSDRPLPVGSVVAVREVQVRGTAPPSWAEVKSCRPQGESWVVGCELLPP